MRVVQLRRQVEPKFLRVGDQSVTESEPPDRAFLDDLLLQNGLEQLVNCCAHILQQDGVPKRDGVLKLVRQLICALGRLKDEQVSLSLHGLDPVVRLHLRVDHERPPGRILKDYSIVNRERVIGKLLLACPATNRNWVGEQILNREVSREVYLCLPEAVLPISDSRLPVREREHTQVGNDG